MEDTTSLSERSRLVKATYATRHAKKKAMDTPNTRKEDGNAIRVSKGPISEELKGSSVSKYEKQKEASPNVSRSTLVSRASRRSVGNSDTLAVASEASEVIEDEAQSSDALASKSNDKVKEPSTTMLPPSAVTEKGTNSELQDHDDLSDDAVSIAESSRATRKRKTEKDRMEWFLEDDDCEISEAHRVKCARCKKWIDLHPKRKYVMKFWLTHKKTCEVENAEEPLEDQRPSNESVAPKLLESEHLEKTEPQAQGANDVEEEVPRQTEPSDDDKSPSQDQPDDVAVTSPQTPKQSSPSQSPRPVSSPSLSKKRGREDSDEEDEPSRSVRPRTDSYASPPGHGLWHALTLPIRSFVEGFKQGLGRNSS